MFKFADLLNRTAVVRSPPRERRQEVSSCYKTLLFLLTPRRGCSVDFAIDIMCLVRYITAHILNYRLK